MRTTSTGNEFARRLAAATLVLCWTAVQADVDLRIGSNQRLQIKDHGRSATLTGTSSRALSMSPNLRDEFQNTTKIFAIGRRPIVDADTTKLLIVTQTPSRREGDASACGAGTEDTLHLLSLQGERLVELSRMVLQSCLTGLALNDDSGRALQQTLESLSDPVRFQLRWLNHPVYGDKLRTLTVTGKAIKVN